MEIKIKTFEGTLHWEDDQDELTSDEFLEVWVKFMHAAGYHPNSIRRSVIDLAKTYQDEIVYSE